jgi:hypothetical protein
MSVEKNFGFGFVAHPHLPGAMLQCIMVRIIGIKTGMSRFLWCNAQKNL